MPLCSEGSSSESSRTTARSEGHSWAWWLQLSCFWSLSSDNCWSGRLVGIWNYTSTFPEWPARQVPPLLCTVSQHLQSGADKIETLPLAITDSKIASVLGTITKELGYRLKAKLGELLPDCSSPQLCRAFRPVTLLLWLLLLTKKKKKKLSKVTFENLLNTAQQMDTIRD